MLNADYVKSFKILGKLAYGYSLAVSQYANLDDILATLQDQVATGLPESNPISSLLRPRYTQIESARDAAPKGVFQAAASDFLISNYFTSKLTTVPAGNTAAAVLAALETEMSAGVDNKTLTTLASTGLVNFFNSMLSAPGAWNTAADASADYKDSVYAIDAVV